MTNFVASLTASQAKALLAIAPKKEVRYYLVGVLIDPKGYAVATDGHTLLSVRIEAFDGVPFIIPRDVLTSAVKATGSKGCIAISQKTLQPTGTAMTIDFTPVDGKFPEWRRVLPTEYSGEAAWYDSELLERCRSVLREIGGSKVFVTQNGTGPGLVETPEGYALVVMPMRVNLPKLAEVGANIRAFLAPQSAKKAAA